MVCADVGADGQFSPGVLKPQIIIVIIIIIIINLHGHRHHHVAPPSPVVRCLQADNWLPVLLDKMSIFREKGTHIFVKAATVLTVILRDPFMVQVTGPGQGTADRTTRDVC